jgi:hypothetical protein
MKRYRNLSGGSGVSAYDIGPDSVAVRFLDGTVYVYSYASAGRDKVEEMKRLALAGRGLATFISQHVGTDYDMKR